MINKLLKILGGRKIKKAFMLVELSVVIICFNMSTTTGMGDANSPGNTLGTTITLSTLITILNSSTIALPADRTCAFYQMQAFEITSRTASIKQLFAINNSNAKLEEEN
jgi:hypothetical protein